MKVVGGYEMKLLMFCDPGIDDAFAIIYALLHPDIELLGVVCSYGNVDKHTAVNNAAHLLKVAGRGDIPIFNGAEMPVTGELINFYPEIHGNEGIGPVKIPFDNNVQIRYLGEVFELIKKYREELVIVDVGRSTTLAACFLLNSETMKLVKEFHLMGGAFLVPGNVTPVAEANFHGDPTSTNLLLRHAHKIYITPLNVTQKTIITKEYAKTLSYHSENKFRDLFVPIMAYYADAYAKLVPGIRGAPFHDLFTVYSAFNKDKVHYISKNVRVETIGRTRGKSIADFRHMEHEDKSNHHIALGFNYEHFLHDVFYTLTKRL
jgi:purine nucleosidase